MLVDRSGRVWAMRPDNMGIAQAVQVRQARREEGGGELPASLARGEPLDGSDFARVVDGVAVVPVLGALLRRYNWAFWSYEEIRRDVALAMQDPRVDSVLLEIDSPGGTVAGLEDLARWLRGQSAKPVQAFVGGMAASAAYWIASAAGWVGMGSGSVAGSIGAVIEYIDIEPMFEAAGARVVRVVAEQSPNKRLDPDSPEGRAELQALVDAAGAAFVTGVAEGRRVSEAQVLDRFGQGLIFDADDAVGRGMADGRTTLEEMIAELAGRDDTFNAAPAAAATEEVSMDWKSVTAAQLREHRADLVEEIEAAARASARAEAEAQAEAAAQTAADEAAAAERERILAIEEVAMPGHEEIVARAKADGSTTAEQVAMQMVKADKARGGSYLAARADDDGKAAVPASPSAGGAGAAGLSANAPIEERAQAEWDADAGLRAEFGDNFDSYLSWRKADAAGKARVLRRA